MQEANDTISVLVVDDEQDIRDASERILQRIGYRVRKASRAEEALAALEEEIAAIVLLDLKMPGMDGMEALGHIHRRYPDVLVIVITGFATVETAIEAMKGGAYDFIPKPFEPDQLRIVVNRASEKIRLRREADSAERERRLTLLDLDTEKSRTRTIIESLPNGLLVTNAEAQVVLMNPACRLLLAVDEKHGTGEDIERYLPDAGLCRLIREISQGRHVDFDDIPSREFEVPGGGYLLAKAQPVLGDRMECLGSVVNFVDITTMKVIDRLKSEFVAKVSHELRSPLSTIHEQLALVIRDMVGEDQEQDQHILSRAKEKTSGMISLIGDLLDLSRIEEGAICRESRRIQLEDILTAVVDFLQARAKAKGQDLQLELPDDASPSLQADPLALESVFGNLVTNAINYTQEGGTIRVVMDVAGINLRVRVMDNGFGIAEKHLDNIFERFYRVKDDKTRFITGTGLGLPIVKGLVDAMGGMIEVDSAPTEGSTFTVLIPCANP
jgi:two-component system phosphate regulon sensor histidine kinase PhoR